MISALDVANYILERASAEDISITPMRLQKLLYILYKEYLKAYKKRLFEEDFQVWQYGPVVNEVYTVFKKYGSNPIMEYYSTNGVNFSSVVPNYEFSKVFETIWHKHKMQDGIYLSNLTHQDNTAWSKSLEAGKIIIRDKDIFQEETF